MSLSRASRITLLALGLTSLITKPALATFHDMQVEQIIGGVDGDSTAQAIQLRMRTAGQDLVQQARLVVRDATGSNAVVLIAFPQEVNNGSFGARILIASSNFADYVSAPLNADFFLSNLIPADYLAAGSLTYEDNFGGVLWRVSFGGTNYTGSNSGQLENDNNGNFGPPFDGPLPTDGFGALQFQGAASALSQSNVVDYAITAGAAVFVNNSGQNFTLTTNADLVVSKTGSLDTVDVGSNVTYTVSVSNNGPFAATSVVVTDALPASLAFVSASSGCVFTNGSVVCDMGTLAVTASTNISIVATAGSAGIVTNAASAASDVNDPVSTNSTGRAITTLFQPPIEAHDLAVTKMKVTKKITLTEAKPSQVKKITVTIQNRSPHSEIIPDATTLSNLVTVAINSQSKCVSSPVAVPATAASFPITLASKKTLTLTFNVTYSCTGDFDYTATVHHEAIDGKADTHAADDACPHDPLVGPDPNPDDSIKDKGCGSKKPDKTLGGPVVTTVILK